MSLDFLPIQASAVPSKHVFSSSVETNTKKRNRINPVLMEALQMRKLALKQSRLDFTKYWATLEFDLPEQEPEIGQDLLADLLSGHNSKDIIDKIIQDFGEDGGDADGTTRTVPSLALLFM